MPGPPGVLCWSVAFWCNLYGLECNMREANVGNNSARFRDNTRFRNIAQFRYRARSFEVSAGEDMDPAYNICIVYIQ